MIFGRCDTELKEIIIDFYKKQYLKFLKIGVGGVTEFNTVVTKLLIRTTE